ncbi:hypothetical protein [Azotobacter beijerinckii]|uniref:Uncharacterized protein n=1 Tax=Azotobacter beijerinckii TaxID=170623 RepID=A0A1I4IGT3_9GAMM|nr:hypothetical protein [Azotobacter beijerinckii]SFB64540.1 hypothetical protein SAMN04244571_04690 [Azotobacter beijerinckii]SFL52986.1 hypothetical protein SAMN04244574_04584 [Azotobacter beijerinckii]
MNLNNALSPDDLAKLFAKHKDKDESHILWVSESGEVRLDRLPAGMVEEEFEKCIPTIRVRLRTYRRGSGYVGKKAAADRDFIGRVHQTLTEQWRVARSNPGIHYLDRYC